MHRLIRRDRFWNPHDLFYALFLPAAVSRAFHINLTSPSPDLPVYVLGIVVSGELLALLSPSRSGSAADFDVVAIALLATGGFTVKQSFAGLAAASLPLAVVLWFRGHPTPSATRMRAAVTLVVVVALGVGPWMVRGVLLSGYPLFPSAVAAVPVEWRMPPGAASRIYAQNQMPDRCRWMVHDPTWLVDCLRVLNWLQREVLLPLAVAVVAVGWRCYRHRRRRGSAAEPHVPALILLWKLLHTSQVSFGAGPSDPTRPPEASGVRARSGPAERTLGAAPQPGVCVASCGLVWYLCTVNWKQCPGRS